jgi:hypothetical protein
MMTRGRRAKASQPVKGPTPFAAPAHVCQLLIVLPNTDPLVWRRIQVPEAYTFWGLHVAIQDAMGWQDYHLHEFELVDPRTDRLKRIGIPDDEFPRERPCVAGWKIPVARYLTYGIRPVRYRYDFGDDWEHTVEFEEMLAADTGPYPRCVAGGGACPPEDVGGTHGYAEFLKVIRNRRHPEHESMRQWAGGSFDPHEFEASTVAFDDPKERWKIAFQH